METLHLGCARRPHQTTHRFRLRLLRAHLHARWQTDPLLIQQARLRRPQIRALSDQHGWHFGLQAGDELRRLHIVSRILARWPHACDVRHGLESVGALRIQHLHRGLETAVTSSGVIVRHEPIVRSPIEIGPMAVRTSFKVLLPTASIMRRTWRLRPSVIAISMCVFFAESRTRRTSAGSVGPSFRQFHALLFRNCSSGFVAQTPAHLTRYVFRTLWVPDS